MKVILQKKDSFAFMRFFAALFIVLFSLCFTSVNAQTKWQLEKKRKQLRKEIQEAQNLLFKSKKEEETLLSELNDINKVISVRSRLLSVIQQEQNQLANEIEQNQKDIKRLERSLATLKKEYADMIVHSYKNKTKQNRLLFLFSSKDFTQAYKRYQYLKQYNSYKKSQGEKIIKEAQELSSLNDSLTLQQEQKLILLALHSKEKDSIQKEKNSQLVLVEKVKKKEKKYIAQINSKQKQEAKIDRQIQKLIAEAIAKSNKKANTKSSSFKLTPEAKKLESTFIANKGKLPWPTKKGVVIRKYGKQKHPTLAGITIQSNGIQVATEKAAKARSIFNGTVLSIQLLPGRKKMVLVQHGKYISAYKNLDDVMVKIGDKIKTGQDIGTIHTDATTGKTVLAFSLFKETQIQNPEPWIGKML